MLRRRNARPEMERVTHKSPSQTQSSQPSPSSSRSSSIQAASARRRVVQSRERSTGPGSRFGSRRWPSSTSIGTYGAQLLPTWCQLASVFPPRNLHGPAENLDTTAGHDNVVLHHLRTSLYRNVLTVVFLLILMRYGGILPVLVCPFPPLVRLGAGCPTLQQWAPGARTM